MNEGKLRQAREGSFAFAEDAIRKGYGVGVVQYSSWAKLRCPPTTNRSAIAEALSPSVSQQTTDMKSALFEASTHLRKCDGQRVAVIVTDGYPDDEDAAMAAAAEATRHYGITIIAIGTHDADHAFLKKLASASELATTVPDNDLKTAITNAARLLPARASSSK